MSTQFAPAYERPQALQSNAVDGLIATHFDRAFLFFNLFIDDPRTCLDLSDAVFRGLGQNGTADEHTFHAHLVQHLRNLPRRNELIPGVSAESVLCWLLKDAADLDYREIAALMTMERDQVKASIAEVRMALLD